MDDIRKQHVYVRLNGIDYLMLFQFLGGSIFAIYLSIILGIYFEGFIGVWFLIVSIYFVVRSVSLRLWKNLILNSGILRLSIFLITTLTSTFLGIQRIGFASSVPIKELQMLLLFCVAPFSVGITYGKYLRDVKWSTILMVWLLVIIVFGILDYQFTLHPSGRLMASAGHSTTYAIISIPVLIWFFVVNSSPTTRIMITILTITIVILSGSRSALITFLVVIFLIALILRRDIVHKLLLIIAILLVVIFSPLLINNISDLFGANRVKNTIYDLQSYGIVNTFEKEGGLRYYITKEYLEKFKDYPILGFGFGLQKTERWDPHNSIIEILGKTGLAGLISFFILCLKPIVNAFKLIKQFKPTFDSFISLFFILLLVESFFTGSIFFNTFFWFVCGCLYNVKLIK